MEQYTYTKEEIRYLLNNYYDGMQHRSMFQPDDDFLLGLYDVERVASALDEEKREWFKFFTSGQSSQQLLEQYIQQEAPTPIGHTVFKKYERQFYRKKNKLINALYLELNGR